MLGKYKFSPKDNVFVNQIEKITKKITIVVVLFKGVQFR
jgi:hypothetical protein